MANFTGTAGDDTVTGTGENDVIEVLGGNDRVAGGGGNDVINGGDGDDVLQGDGAAGNLIASRAANGTQGNAQSQQPQFSPDGSRIAFNSTSSNLTPGDANGFGDLFIRDLNTGAITLVSTSATGVQGNAGVGNALPSFSPDGTRIAFSSTATNLVAGDGNGFGDIFIKTLATGAIALVSTNAAGELGNGFSARPDFASDGNRLLFDSTSSNLVAGDTTNNQDVFLKNLATGVVTRVSASATGEESANGSSFGGVFSPDGNSVLFVSAANNLVAGDTNNLTDIFLKDLRTGAITRVSTTATGEQQTIAAPPANPGSFVGAFTPVFSPDGTKVAFESAASNLVAGDTNNQGDVFVKDLVTGVVTRVSVNAAGVQGDNASFGPRFTPDGQSIVFGSVATNLIAGDTNGLQDVFVKNLITGVVTRVATGVAGAQPNGAQFTPIVVSSTGAIAFGTAASNLLPDDANAQQDIIVVGAGLGAGDDVLSGGAGNDLIGGGAGADRIDGGDGNDFIGGEDGNDVISGGAGADILFGDAGNDLIGGGIGADSLYGGAGDDFLGGEADNDFLDGGEGRDVLFGDAGDDVLLGGAGNDSLFGQDGADRLNGQDGDDVMEGGAGNDVLSGGAGADTAVGGAGNDLIGGGLGNDVLSGGDGDDFIGGEDGADTISGGAGADVLFGDAGNDLIGGGIGADSLFGGAGDDFMGGEGDNDILDGGEGRDILFGDGGDDLLLGGTGNDSLIGQDGADRLFGQDGDDVLDGGAGNDLLEGGAGRDVMVGGAGNDRFIFNALSDSMNAARDRIEDFAAGDLIDVSGIDANTTTAGDQAFTLVSAFSNQAGQAIAAFNQTSGLTTLSLDQNGDGVADFVLEVTGNFTAASNFVL